ncbi:MAG: ArnT family glycosyltransferase [Phototrophicaceae bacterium]
MPTRNAHLLNLVFPLALIAAGVAAYLLPTTVFVGLLLTSLGTGLTVGAVVGWRNGTFQRLYAQARVWQVPQLRASLLPYAKTFIALVAIIGAAVLAPTVALEQRSWIYGFVLLGGLLLATMHARSAPLLDAVASPPVRLWRRPRHWAALALGVLLIAHLTQLVLEYRAFGRVRVPMGAQYIEFWLGVALITWGACAGFRWPFGKVSAVGVALIAIFTLAFGVRAWRVVNELVTFIDETIFFMAVGHSDDGSILFQAASGFVASPFVFTWTQYLLSQFNGGDLFWGLRFTNVIVGALTVPAVYFLVRELFRERGETFALVCAGLLAVMPIHVFFSRVALYNVTDSLFGVMALAWLAHGFRTGKGRSFILGGLGLGLATYFYEGGRFIFPLLALYLTGYTFLSAHLRCSRARWGQVMVFWACAALLALPFFLTMRVVSGTYTLRLDFYTGAIRDIDTVLRPPRDLWAVLWGNVRLYTSMGDNLCCYFFSNKYAFVAPALIPFFLVGIMAVIARLFRRSESLLAVWFMVPIVAVTLLDPLPVTARLVLTLPALAILLTLGIFTLGEFVADPPQVRRWALTVMLALMVIQPLMLFTVYLPDRRMTLWQQYENTPRDDLTDAIYRSRGFPAGAHLHILESTTNTNLSYEYEKVVTSLAPHLIYHLWRPEMTYIATRSYDHSENHIFVIPHGRTDLIKEVRSRYKLLPPLVTLQGDMPEDVQRLIFYAPADIQRRRP